MQAEPPLTVMAGTRQTPAVKVVEVWINLNWQCSRYRDGYPIFGSWPVDPTGLRAMPPTRRL